MIKNVSMTRRKLIAVTGGAGDLFSVGSAYLVTSLVQVVSVTEAVSGGGEKGNRYLGSAQQILHVLGQMMNIPHHSLVTVTISPHTLQSETCL